MWPKAAREHTTVRYIKGATHDFDSRSPQSAYRFYDDAAPGMVSVVVSPKDADEARQAVVRFFVEHLNP
jgi:dienelactone hydrolase